MHDGPFHGWGGEALVFTVDPRAVFGFGKGDFSQTRWSFEQDEHPAAPHDQ